MRRALFRARNLLGALFLLFHSFAVAQSPPWLSSFQTGFDQLKQGNLPSASALFDSLWRSYGRDVILATSIGGVLDATGHHDQATVWYQRALALQPNFSAALRDLAMNCAVRGKLDQAAALLRRDLQLNPGDGKTAYHLGLILLRLQQYRDAASVLRTAETAANHPPPEQVYLAQATAAFHLAHYSEAIALLSKCGKPGSAAPFQLLGSALALSGNLPAAIKTFQQGVSAYPANPDLYFRLTMAFAEGRRDQAADAVLRDASEQIPNSPLLDYARAVLAEMKGRDDEATTWALKSLNSDDKQPEAWGLLGTIYDQRGETEKAIEAYGKALALRSKGTYNGVKYAELLIRTQRYGEAMNLLGKLENAYPNDAQVSRALGKLYRAEGNEKEAESFVRRSIRLDNTDPQAHYALAQILHHQGRTEEEKVEVQAFKNSKEKASAIRLLELVDEGAIPQAP